MGAFFIRKLQCELRAPGNPYYGRVMEVLTRCLLALVAAAAFLTACGKESTEVRIQSKTGGQVPVFQKMGNYFYFVNLNLAFF